MSTPTPRQLEIYREIRKRCLAGKPPSIRELMRHFGFSNTNGIKCHMKALQRKGIIDWDHGQQRTLRIVRQPPWPLIDLESLTKE